MLRRAASEPQMLSQLTVGTAVPIVQRNGQVVVAYPHKKRGEAMIVVTRLNDSQFAINPDLIERIHESPDTTLVMLDGAKYIVTESLAEVIARITEYRARVINLASAMQDEADAHPRPVLRPVARPLGLVEPLNEQNDQNNPLRST